MAERDTAPEPRDRKPEPRVRRRPGRAGGVALFLAVMAIALVVVIAVSAWGLLLRPWSDVPAGRTVAFVVDQGDSTQEIAVALAEAGVISNPNMFRLQSRLAGADGRLRAGSYDLVSGMPIPDIIERLRQGPPVAYTTVTIPEGFVIEQIAERVEVQTGIPSEEFAALANGGIEEFPDRTYLADVHEGSLEGYLFPKTYRVKEGSDARDVIEMMLDQFELEMDNVDTTYTEQRGLSLHELVTIASMIESEARVPEERALISSVIYNRLDVPMRLEICATIEYVVPGNRLRLSEEDLAVESPYNTYRNDGLPPGPISNPGLASLQAASAPADTEYIFYVLTGTDGSHTFATNIDDFLAAKQKSKEVFGE
jgi:UPF0755 protein